MIKLKTLLLEIEGTEPNVYYHVTLVKNVNSIKKTGLQFKKKPMWTGNLGQDIRQAKGVFVFENFYDAKGWAFRMAWDKPNEKIVILKLNTTDTDFVEDTHFEAQANLGKWLAKMSSFEPSELIEVIPFDIKKWTAQDTLKINGLRQKHLMRENVESIKMKSIATKPIIITAGIHGDEPAGIMVADIIRQQIPEIFVMSPLNPDGVGKNKRRDNGVDLNRQFGKDNEEANAIEQKILDHNPSLVINLHEDDTSSGCYAYCTEENRELGKLVLNAMKAELPTVKSQANGDRTDDGIITKCGTKGTLESRLRDRGIRYLTIETPTRKEISKRVNAMLVGIIAAMKEVNSND